MAVFGVLTATGCHGPDDPATTTPSRPYTGVSINPYEADDLVASIAASGLPVRNPEDVTQRDCPKIGCHDKIESDTISVMTFPTTGGAELFAGSTHHRFQIVNVVMEFAATVTPDRQQAYETALSDAIE